jgi:cation transport protein ChaC
MWVFGYGSLLWNPGFDFVERRRATLAGYRRAFRLWSEHYRGTPEARGLVLGLDEEAGAECEGVAFRVAKAAAAKVHAYLRERELVSYAYHERFLPVQLQQDGSGETDAAVAETVEAVCYVLDPDHAQYAGAMAVERCAEIIASARGKAGPNDEYLHRTLAQLGELGIDDPDLTRLDALVRQCKAAGAG